MFKTEDKNEMCCIFVATLCSLTTYSTEPGLMVHVVKWFFLGDRVTKKVKANVNDLDFKRG